MSRAPGFDGDAGAPSAPRGDQAVFDALVGSFLAMASLVRGAGRGGAAGRAADCAWAWSPIEIPEMNRVLRPRLAGSGAALEAAIEAIDARFGGVPHTWWLDLGATPADLAETIRWVTGRPGEGVVPVMDLPLAGREGEAAAPAGVTVRLVRSSVDLVAAERLCAMGFGATDEEAEPFASLFEGLEAPQDGPLVVAVADLDGRPAGTALAIVQDGAAGIYNVATLPSARRRGLGRAVMEAVLAEAGRLGARRAVLESSAEGYALYRGMGFRDAGAALVLTVSPAR